jgi:exopolysaccharide production protein ExoQ
MPPRLVLFMCILWIAYVLYWEIQSKPEVSLALWLPTLWMIRCGSRGIDGWFSPGVVLETDARYDPLFLGVLMAGGIVVLIYRRHTWARLMEYNRLIFLFYGFMVASTVWSIAPGVTAYKLIRPFGDLMMALIVVTERNPKAAIITMFRRCTILLIPLSVVLIRYFPDYGRGLAKHWAPNPWLGVGTHKNTLGQLCLVGIFTITWCYFQSRRAGEHLSKWPFGVHHIFLPYLVMILFLLNGGGHSRSVTSMMCIAVGFFFMWGIARFRGREYRLITTLLFGSVVVVFAFVVSEAFFQQSIVELVATSVGKDGTLTGREWLWQDVIRLGMAHPIGGHGYGAFWGDWVYSQLSPQVDYGPEQCHNGYLETFADLGLVGVLLLLLASLSALRNALAICRKDFEYGRFRFVLLATILVLNYTEATFPRGTHLLWFTFLVAALFHHIPIPDKAREPLPTRKGRRRVGVVAVPAS